MCTFVIAQAAPTTFSYQGRILSSAGGSPGFTMASFSFSVMIDKAGGKNPNCTIFREQKDLVPLSTDGLFDVAIGEGTANFPNSSAKVYDYMNNTGTVSCAEGGTFLLSASDKRFLDVQFNPNGTSGWQHITPASEIRAVPYATNAISAEKLGGLVATDYVRKTDLTGCTAGQFVTYNGSAFGCDTPAGGGSSFDASYSIKGLVQFLTNAATSGIVVTNGVAQVNTGTGANQIVKLDGTGKLPAVDGSALTGIVASSATTATTAGSATNFSGSLTGDVSGTQSATSVDKVKGMAVVTTGAANGKVLKYSSGSLVFADDDSGSTVVDSSYSAKGIVQFDTSAIVSGITVASGVAKVNTGTSANQIVKLDSSGKLPAVDGSALTNLPTPTSVTSFSGSLVGDVSGTQGATSVDKIKGATVDTTGIANGKILKYDGTKWVMSDDNTGGSPADSSYSTKGIVQFDTSAIISGITVASGVAKVNAGTGANQIVQLDSSSKLPAVDGSALTNIVASSLSGTLAIIKGGTGQTTKTAAFDALSPLAAKGSIVTHDGTNNVTLPVGSTNGYVLMVDSAQATGIKWAAPTATDLTTITGTGIVQRTGAGTYSALGTTAPINVTGSNIGLAYSTGLTTSSGSLVVDVGTTANKIVQLDSSGKLPAIDGSALTNLPTPTSVTNFSGSLTGDVSGTQGATSVDKIKGATVDTTGIASGKILKYDGTKWTMSDDATGGAPADSSYSAKGIVQFDTSAIVSGITVASGVAKVNTGTTANQIVQLDSSAKLPAVDGSALTNVVASSISGTLAINKGGTGQTTKTAAFDALSPLTTSGDLATHDGTNNVRIARGTTGQILSSTATGLQWINSPTSVTNFSGSLVGDVSGTQGATSVDKIKGATVDTTGIASGKILKYDGTKWTMADDATGTAPGDSSYAAKGIVQFDTSAIISGITVASGVAKVNAGTGANQIVQLDSSGKLPAIDGSALTNIVASSISGTLAINKGGTGQTTKTAAFDALSPLAAKGSIVTHDGTNNITLAVGSTNGHVLMVDSAQTAGIKWAAPTATDLTTITGTGIVQRTGAGTYAALGTTAPINVTGSNIGLAYSTGLTTSSGSLVVDTGTTTGKIVAMDTGNRLPAVDGSQLTNIVASSFSGTLPVANGGTGATTLTGAGILVNGGNSFGAAASVGTNDAFDFKIETSGSDRITVASGGNVGIGTSSTINDKLEVNGSIRGKSYDNGTTTTIDWSRGNTQSVTTNCGSQMTFSNMRDGGVYTLAVTASTTFSGSCTFGQTSPDTLSGTAGSGAFYFLPANATASGANAVYSFMRIGTKVYVNWSSGYAN
jgi:DUF2075 family protein